MRVASLDACGLLERAIEESARRIRENNERLDRLKATWAIDDVKVIITGLEPEGWEDGGGI